VVIAFGIVPIVHGTSSGVKPLVIAPSGVSRLDTRA
jgi:hypothetical protein